MSKIGKLANEREVQEVINLKENSSLHHLNKLKLGPEIFNIILCLSIESLLLLSSNKSSSNINTDAKCQCLSFQEKGIIVQVLSFIIQHDYIQVNC